MLLKSPFLAGAAVALLSPVLLKASPLQMQSTELIYTKFKLILDCEIY
jgi:hypothetical protein